MSTLDMCCGSKMFWFDKNQKGTVFGDVRSEHHILCDGRALSIKPDIIFDFRCLPFNDCQFDRVIFDPPHLINAGDNGWQVKKYGKLRLSWKDDLSEGFSEGFRVLKPTGTLIFKWNEVQIKVAEIINLAGKKPLIGHASGKRSNTHWLCFSG